MIPPVLVALIVAIAMWVLAIAVPVVSSEIPLARWFAVVFWVAGIGVAILGVAAFRYAHTTVDPTKPGSAKTLVKRGIYGISRNPMYLGFLLVLLGWGLWLANALALLMLPGFVWYMNRFQIGPEERALETLFGSTFTAYRDRVRRWL